MTQRDENGKDHPNVTTALLTDRRESGGYEMSILETNEKDNSVVKNGSSDALSLINHNGTKNSNDGYCNQTKKTNELHTQQELLQVDLMSKFSNTVLSLLHLLISCKCHGKVKPLLLS